MASNTLSNILTDAEKIVPELVPPPATISNVVGVLIKHIEALAGSELGQLSEDVLGITPPAPTEAETQAAAEQSKIEKLESELAQLQTEVNVLRVGSGQVPA